MAKITKTWIFILLCITLTGMIHCKDNLRHLEINTINDYFELTKNFLVEKYDLIEKVFINSDLELYYDEIKQIYLILNSNNPEYTVDMLIGYLKNILFSSFTLIFIFIIISIGFIITWIYLCSTVCKEPSNKNSSYLRFIILLIILSLLFSVSGLYSTGLNEKIDNFEKIVSKIYFDMVGIPVEGVEDRLEDIIFLLKEIEKRTKNDFEIIQSVQTDYDYYNIMLDQSNLKFTNITTTNPKCY